MSEAESGVDASRELVVRVVVEQPEQPREKVVSDATITDLAAIVLRLTEVVERLAVVDDNDAEIVKRIQSFDERIKVLEEKLAKLEQSSPEQHTPPPQESGTLAVTPEVFEAIEERLQERLSELIDKKIAEAAFKATGSATKPQLSMASSVENTPPAQQNVQEHVNGNGNGRLPDYMITSESELLSDNLIRTERILLFFLAQPDQRYTSPTHTAGKDIREVLQIKDSDWGNALALLKEEGVVWSIKKNTRRTTTLGIDKEAIEKYIRTTLPLDRLKNRIEQVEFTDGTPLDQAVPEQQVAELISTQREVLAVLANASPALITEDFTKHMRDQFGDEAHHYIDEIDSLVGAGYVVWMRYGALYEYRLTPKGIAAYEQLLQHEADSNGAPPFLVISQASI